MRKKLDSRSRAGRTLISDSQLELALTQRELATATVVQFPTRPKPVRLSIADAKRRLLEFAARLPD